MTENLMSMNAASALAEGRHSDPFAVLGVHAVGVHWVLRVFIPAADSVEAIDHQGKSIARLDPIGNTGAFAAELSEDPRPDGYRLKASRDGETWVEEDPYRFSPVIGEMDEYLFNEGSHKKLWDVLGAHVLIHEGIPGVHFAVWAPNAHRVSVIGSFNYWDGRRHPMRRRGSTGIWEIFLPGVAEGALYKYEIVPIAGAAPFQKSDPYGFEAEPRPATASRVARLDQTSWQDQDWMAKRSTSIKTDQPISIYEVHLGSWRKADEGNRPLSYTELASHLVPYVKELGFTHIELLPITEHPFDGSWGYQPIGLYAPTSRYGSLAEFQHFIDACHRAGLGVILDWVPGHFPTDAHGLAQFDGTPLYEHADPREGFHNDWNTLIFNYGRHEVANYLTANALYWLQEHHLDGLRVDAVASMLYRDYSRKEGEWVPNAQGGRENWEAIALLKTMNVAAYGACDGIMTIAEESTAWPGVSSPVDAGGLGFGYKWNMGWMNDTLSYMQHDPVHRKHHHNEMTFGLVYAFSENFILPLSHDEVVHGKGSLLARMPGDAWQQFANLRAYYGFMWAHPGKKLLFMGQEFAQGAEWNHDQSLDWHLLDIAWHKGVQNLIADLNELYRQLPALHQRDCRADGFQWIDGGNAEHSIFVWARYGEEGASPVLAVSNFTPIERHTYRIGVPTPGLWQEAINTNSDSYGGSGSGNTDACESEPIGAHGCDNSISITVPPLATVWFVLDS